jgi:hypothetical protein
MAGRIIVYCGDEEKKLFISSLEGATLHEVALPSIPICLASSLTIVAVSGNDNASLLGQDNNIRLVSVEDGDIFALFPIPSTCGSLAFNEHGTKLACGLSIGLIPLRDLAPTLKP